jgi:hypothetical protein
MLSDPKTSTVFLAEIIGVHKRAQNLQRRPEGKRARFIRSRGIREHLQGKPSQRYLKF